jgi:hypothetical protein
VPITVIAISDDDFLLRRLNRKGQLNPDKTVNSNAYKKAGKPDPEISVDVATLTTVRESLLRAPNPSEFTMGIIQTATVRALGLAVQHQPTDENPAHSVITGNASKATCRDLAKETWLAALERI